MTKHVDTESRRRTLRTIYQAIVGILLIAPVVIVVVLAALPTDLPFAAKFAAVGASTVAAVTAGTALVTTLEAVGAIPGWLLTGDVLTLAESTRRTLRTAYQGLVSLLTSGPLVVAAVLGLLQTLAVDVSGGGQVAAIAGAVTAGLVIATRILTALEDRGVIPAWLRD